MRILKSRPLRWVFGAVAAMALVIAAVAIYGATRPREHQARRTVVLAQSPQELFAILEDVEAYACWRSSVETVEVLEPEPLRFRESGADGAMTFVVIERDPPFLLVTRIDDPELPFGGTWTYELAPKGQGTALTITENGFVDGVLVRGVASLLIDPVASMTLYQDDLQRHKRCD